MDKDFKVLTGEEVANLDAAAQIKYFNDLNEYKANQMDLLKVELKENASAELKEQIAELRSEIAEDNKEQMKSIQKALEVQGLALNKLMAKSEVPSIKTIEKYLYEIKNKFA